MNDLVRRNKVRVYLYMTVMVMLLGLLGSFLSQVFEWGLTGTGCFLLAGAIINLIAYFYSDRLILQGSKAKLLTEKQVPELFVMVEELVKESRLPMPKLYLVDDSSMNAFATGRNPQHAAVAVTRGLLEKLTPEEVRGVVAHELAHIQNWDTLLMTAIAIIAGVISILADAFWRSRIISKAEEKDRSGVLGIISVVLAVFAPLAAMFIQMAISRQREFLADASGAQMAKNPSGLASALHKISKDRRPLPGMNAATAHLYFSNPMKEGGLVDKLFSTHPPIAERIERLQKINL